MAAVGMAREDAIRKIFNQPVAAIGMVHCLALPGAPRFSGTVDAVYDRAVRDAEAYAAAGFDGLIVENHGDIPFLRPGDIGSETVAGMAVVTERVRRAVGMPIGINVLANAAIPALSVAQAAGAAFVRVNQWANAYVANEGFVEGDAARALRHRAAIGAQDVMIFADAHVKHGAHAIVADRTIAELVRDVEFFDADAVIATGQRTGDAVDLEELRAIAKSTSLPVLVGSGVTADNVAAILTHARAVIVGSSLKTGGVWWDPVDQAKAARFMDVVTAVRAGR